MAKKDAATDRKQKGKPATAKSPKTTAPAKPPKKKGGKGQQPLNREERKKAAWLRKTERKVAQQAITEVGAKASAGLTFDQLENPSLAARQSKLAGPTFEQTLLKILKEQAQQFESTKPVSLLTTPDPEVYVFPDGQRWTLSWYETSEEPLSSIATRKVVAEEIRLLLKKTELIFTTHHRGLDILAVQLAAGELFEREPEESFIRLRAAEVVLADDPMAVENFLEEVWDRVAELQLIAGAFGPESELEKSARLELIDEATADRLKKAVAEEAIRLDLSQRLAGLTASTTGAPAEVDEIFATLIAEAAQAAEVQQHGRAVFRKTLQGLRRKEREGRRFSSKSSEKFGDDEEFIQFLASHREEPGAKQALLTLRLEAEIAAAEKRWADLKSRLAASANDPETAVAQNATTMKNILGDLAQIRALHVQLEELDRLG